MSLCGTCGKNPRRGPGLNCLPCEATAKRRRRAAKKASAPGRAETPEFKRSIGKTRRYIVTAAQNNTLAHAGFLAALRVAAAYLQAEIIVVPYRYKNPSGLAPGTDLRTCGKRFPKKDRCARLVGHEGDCSPRPDVMDQLWWDPELVPFLHNQRTRLNENLVLAADVKIQPTASEPLSGFEALTGAESCLIAHPKLQFKTVPVPREDDYPKILTTTGAVTVQNYSNTKAGALGEFHYTLGATLVEVDGKTFHLRQLLGDEGDGSFTDLDQHFTAFGVSKAPSALALVCGDLHQRLLDPDVKAATFGAGGIVDVLNPERIVAHDIWDGETTNPHETHDLFLAAARANAQRTDVLAELQDMVDFANEIARGRELVIVDSNHHDFLRRWVVRGLNQGFHDAKNLGVFLDSAAYMYATRQMTPGGAEYGDPFPYWVKRLGAKQNIRCLGPHDSFKVAEIECALHGHNGPNGARGSMKNLARIGVKSISGHGHAPGIFEGHWRVGTSTPRRQSYHRGPGNNLNTHCVAYASGKRCLITIIGSQWRLSCA